MGKWRNQNQKMKAGLYISYPQKNEKEKKNPKNYRWQNIRKTYLRETKA